MLATSSGNILRLMLLLRFSIGLNLIDISFANHLKKDLKNLKGNAAMKSHRN